MKLMPYQISGAEFLAKNKRAFLADQMGLGKSAQAITACVNINASRVVVICPAVARINWQREFEMWGDGKAEVFIESFDRIAQRIDIQRKIKGMTPDVMIVDEAHYLKTRTTKRTTVLYGKGCVNTGIAQYAKHVWLLTGTPCPNDAGELWSHLRALWPNLITPGDKPLNYMDFIEKYCVVSHSIYGPKILANRNTAELRKILSTIMLRRKADEVLTELPAISWHVVPVEPEHALRDLAALEQTPEIEALRDSLEQGVINDSVAMASLRRVTGLAKASIAAKLIHSELSSGEYNKIVVFAQHLDVVKTLIAELEPFGVVSITGQTTEGKRQDAIDRFQNDKDVKVFVGQLQACSTAITLHAANQVVFVEQSWTPSDNAQAAKRCHRIGQKRPVFVRMLGLAKSIDEAVAKVLVRKSQMISELLEDEK